MLTSRRSRECAGSRNLTSFVDVSSLRLDPPAPAERLPTGSLTSWDRWKDYRRSSPRGGRRPSRPPDMAESVLVDAGFLIALLSRRDRHHHWAAAQSPHLTRPWRTCEAALSEAFFLLGAAGRAPLAALLLRHAVIPAFDLGSELNRVLRLMEKYADVPMSLADACLVRMSETASDAVLLTTDRDFRIYRRYGRQVVRCLTPY